MTSVSEEAAHEPMTRRQRREAGLGNTGPIPLPHFVQEAYRPLVTIVVLAGCALLAVSGFAGSGLVALTLLLGGGILAWGWAGLLALPSPRGTMGVLWFGNLALVGAAVATTEEPYLRWLPGALALSLLVAFVHQLARRDGRPRLVESVASTVAALAIMTSGACLVPLPFTLGGGHVVAAAAGAIGASALTDLCGKWERVRPWLLPLAMVGGGLTSVAFVTLSGGFTWGPAALLGVVAAGVSHAVRRLLGHQPTMTGARPQLVSAVASLLTPGVVVYVVSRLFVA